MSFMRAIGQSSLALASRAGVREQRHLARVLDRGGHVALVPGAVTGDPARADLAAVGDVLAEQARVLVVHVADLVVAEGADLLLGLANWWLRHRGAPLESPANAGMVSTCLLDLLERWFVGVAGVRRPRVLGPTAAAARLTAGRLAAVPTALVPAAGGLAPAAVTAATGTARTAGAVGPGDLGGSVPQGRADVVDLDLVHGPLLAFLRLVLALLEPTGHDDPHTALQRLGDVLRRLPPHVATEEEAVAVLPLVGRPVHDPGR